MDLERFPISPSAKRMLSSVSEEFYAKSYVAKWLYQVMGLEWDSVWSVVNALPEQAFVETATWGLLYHELKWGLPVRENLGYEMRRRFIYEKRDVHKPMNPWAMEQLVNDITGQLASIRDSNDDLTIPTNTFVLHIDCTEPVNLAPVIANVSKLKQAHVQYGIQARLPEAVSLFRVGAAGSIITRLAPVEQRDVPPKPQTIYVGGTAQAVTLLSPAEQSDSLSAAHTVRIGGQGEVIERLSPAEQPDNLTAAQTVRTGGQGQITARLASAEQPDAPPKPHTVRTGGAGTIVSVLRGRVVEAGGG